jgi:hypothetical protein
MTPLALFAYSRPAHVAAALDSLARCARLKECRVHVFCDGPKGPEDAAAVAETRRVVRERAGGLGAEVIEREANLGLARSVVTGVTDLCARYGRVIVVEDDLVVAPDFLAYMLAALDRYEDADDVYQVSGFMVPVAHPEAPDAFFLPLTTTWGWATWARAWAAFDGEATGAAEALGDPETRRRFDLGGAYPYAAMLEDRLGGRNDSWGILWWWAVFKAHGLVLHPRRSLARAGGMDGTGTHSGAVDPLGQPGVEAFRAPVLGAAPRLPDRVAPDGAALARVTAYLDERFGRRSRTWTRRLARRLGAERPAAHGGA